MLNLKVEHFLYLLICLFTLYCCHYAKEVAAPNLGDVFFGIATLKQFHCDTNKIVVAVATNYSTTTIEIATDTHVVDTSHLNHVT